MSAYLTPAARRLKTEIETLAHKDRAAAKLLVSSTLAALMASEPDFVDRAKEALIESAFTAIGCRPDEAFMAVFFDRAGNLLKVSCYENGTTTRCVLYARQLFSDALACDATSLILAHNHPSGNPAPSFQDREVTRRVRDLARQLEIELLGHYVVAGTKRVEVTV